MRLRGVVPSGRNETRLDLGIFIALLPPEHHGGAELQADRMARELAARGHSVQVFARRPHWRARAGAEWRDGVCVHRRAVLPLAGVRGAADLVLGVAQALHARPRLLLAYMTFNNGLQAVVAARLLRVPVVIWQRLEGESMSGPPWQRRLAVALEAHASAVWLQTASFATTLARAYARDGRRAAWARLEPRVRIVGNGIDVPHGAAPGPPPPWRALFVGRLHVQKDLPTLLEAARAVPECEIWIAGDGTLRATLEAAAPPSVRFLGEQPHARVVDLLRQSRALVLCSRREGVPNVVLEALAHARPVIATPVGAIPEYVRDGINGWIVPVGDVAALAAALRALRDDAVWQERAAAAPQAVAACAWPVLVTRVEAELQRVAGMGA